MSQADGALPLVIGNVSADSAADRLFFARLTDRLLPEETYHTYVRHNTSLSCAHVFQFLQMVLGTGMSLEAASLRLIIP